MPSGSLGLVANAHVLRSAPRGGCFDPAQGHLDKSKISHRNNCPCCSKVGLHGCF